MLHTFVLCKHWCQG